MRFYQLCYLSLFVNCESFVWAALRYQTEICCNFSSILAVKTGAMERSKVIYIITLSAQTSSSTIDLIIFTHRMIR